MLSLFPSLLAFDQVAPFIVRLALASVFVFWAYRAFRDTRATAHTKAIGLIEGLAGIFILIGLWTQGAALVAAIDLAIRIGHKIGSRSFLTDGINYYLLLLALSLTLLVTGPGFLGFDLPL